MVPLLYAATQTILVLLWLCDWRYWKRGPDLKVFTIQEIRKLQTPYLTTPELLWYVLFLLSVIGATIFAIGGTSKSTYQYNLQVYSC